MPEQNLKKVIEQSVREALEGRHIEDGTIAAFDDVVDEIVKNVTAIPGLIISHG